jgi:hypothetical protein
MAPITHNSIGLDGNVFTERRAERRRKVFKGAKLRFNGGYGALDCLVRNFSDKGARLAFGDIAAVPSRFEFRLSGAEAPVPAVVRWRGVEDVGIEFMH